MSDVGWSQRDHHSCLRKKMVVAPTGGKECLAEDVSKHDLHNLEVPPEDVLKVALEKPHASELDFG